MMQISEMQITNCITIKIVFITAMEESVLSVNLNRKKA